METVETVVRGLKLLLVHDLSRGLMINTPIQITVSTVFFSKNLSFLSVLFNIYGFCHFLMESGQIIYFAQW